MQDAHPVIKHTKLMVLEKQRGGYTSNGISVIVTLTKIYSIEMVVIVAPPWRIMSNVYGSVYTYVRSFFYAPK